MLNCVFVFKCKVPVFSAYCGLAQRPWIHIHFIVSPRGAIGMSLSGYILQRESDIRRINYSGNPAFSAPEIIMETQCLV